MVITRSRTREQARAGAFEHGPQPLDRVGVALDDEDAAGRVQPPEDLAQRR
jgi:hypothetical protein